MTSTHSPHPRRRGRLPDPAIRMRLRGAGCLPLLLLAFVVAWWLDEIPLRETAAASAIEGAGEELELHAG